MGEIKSTLDLVLERTKHLALSKTEKQEQEREELRKRTRGFLQKFTENLLSYDQLIDAFKQLKSSYKGHGTLIMLREVLGRILLTQDNHELFRLLNEFFHVDARVIQTGLQNAQREIQLLNRLTVASILQNLKENYNLSGSAVIPNLQNSDARNRKLLEIENKFSRMKEKWLDAHQTE